MTEPPGIAAAEVLAGELVRRAAGRGVMLATAESCTAGLVAECVGRVPGASRVLWGAFVSYTVDAKCRMLGVAPELVARHGPVSRECALAMAEGALAASGVGMALSVTGLAGPDGDGTAVPVGTVWIGLARRGMAAEAWRFHWALPRNELRQAAAAAALRLLVDALA